MPSVNFFEEDIDFTLSNEDYISHWIKTIIEKEGFALQELNFIFCSDEYLYQMNVDYLNHDTYTDIITFDNSEEDKQIEGDIFISIDRVRDNANSIKSTFEDELARVIIHGVLHLMGHKDKTPEEEKGMREKEEACLSLRP
ncbi:rRNA maturation RNase YbeY [Fulvivirga kasyanovii]|uniref:Endoribonuclease YbeY n=1 Tax=Fulvivirga kasyanovii TaxID=396812 RepID=A0ABW9RSI6_9BACT|nr:rRNA maturation RNase YbeY [Fulvivirga kasyanovii]MTI26856.1 rRNA maturation RNase YbeY [Fulvivirga kasyanovii]